MITQISININSYININYKYLSDLSAEDLNNYLTHILFISTVQAPHYHKNVFCTENDLTNNTSYKRNIIHLHMDGTRDTLLCTIKVMKCNSTVTYHSVLPIDIIVPYHAYSLSSIMMVLAYHFIYNHTIEDTCNHFNIGISSFYEWKSLFEFIFHKYEEIFFKIISKCSFHQFLKALNTIDIFIKFIFEALNSTNHSPFYYNLN